MRTQLDNAEKGGGVLAFEKEGRREGKKERYRRVFGMVRRGIANQARYLFLRDGREGEKERRVALKDGIQPLIKKQHFSRILILNSSRSTIIQTPCA